MQVPLLVAKGRGPSCFHVRDCKLIAVHTNLATVHVRGWLQELYSKKIEAKKVEEQSKLDSRPLDELLSFIETNPASGDARPDKTSELPSRYS